MNFNSLSGRLETGKVDMVGWRRCHRRMPDGSQLTFQTRTTKSGQDILVNKTMLRSTKTIKVLRTRKSASRMAAARDVSENTDEDEFHIGLD